MAGAKFEALSTEPLTFPFVVTVLLVRDHDGNCTLREVEGFKLSAALDDDVSLVKTLRNKIAPACIRNAMLCRRAVFVCFVAPTEWNVWCPHFAVQSKIFRAPLRNLFSGLSSSN